MKKIILPLMSSFPLLFILAVEVMGWRVVFKYGSLSESPGVDNVGMALNLWLINFLLSASMLFVAPSLILAALLFFDKKTRNFSNFYPVVCYLIFFWYISDFARLFWYFD